MGIYFKYINEAFGDNLAEFIEFKKLYDKAMSTKNEKDIKKAINFYQDKKYKIDKSFKAKQAEKMYNELYFLYAKNPTLSYSVYYVKYKEDENGNQITYDYGDVPSDDMLLGKKEGIVSAGYITERAEEIDGWTINGKESQTLKLVLNESDNTLYFYYDENTTGEYLVNFFFMNENGEYENGRK